MKKKFLIIIAIFCFVVGFAVAIKMNPPSRFADTDLSAATFKSAQGKELTFADFPAKPKLVNFWATWCAPCVYEMPLLDKVSKQYEDVYFVGIAADDENKANAFVQENSITYDILTPKFDIFLLFEKYGNDHGVLPYTVLLDEKNEVVATKIGEFTTAEEIEEFILENFR